MCVCVFVGVIYMYEKGREIFMEKEKMYGFWKAFVNFPARSCSSIRACWPKYDSHSPSPTDGGHIIHVFCRLRFVAAKL